MKKNLKTNKYNLPDFLVVGGAKCGTTSLFYYLEQHPNIFTPSEKEPHFFSFYNDKPHFTSPADLRPITDISEYSDLFKGSRPNQSLCEASTSYLYDYENVIRNIKDIYGSDYKKIKILILLRNPTDRAWSQYWQFKKFYHEPLTFKEAIEDDLVEKRLKDNWNYYYDYLGFGKYYSQVKAYLDNFDNVKILYQENFLENSEETVKDVLKFLDIVDDGIIDTDRKFNPSGSTKKNLYGIIWKLKSKTKILNFFKFLFPLKVRKKIIYFFMDKALEKEIMREDERERIISIFKEDNENLYNLLKDEEIKLWN